MAYLDPSIAVSNYHNFNAMDDEGYTSPSEEDFRYNPAKKPLSQYSVIPSGENESSLSSANMEDGIPWEIIAKTPYTTNRHLTWDDIQVPLSHRFQRKWTFPSNITSKRLRKTAFLPYFTDSIEKSNETVDLIWRIFDDPQEAVHELNNTTADSNIQVVANISKSTSAVNELQQTNAKLIYIPLQQFIQHSLHLLAGRGSRTYILNPETQQFTKNPIVLLKGIGPTTLASYCDGLLQCGSLVTKLNSVSRFQDIWAFSEEGPYTNLMFNTILEFISNYLKLYQTILMIKGSALRTLVQLSIFIKPFHHQLKTLENVYNSLLNGRNALDLIAGLNCLLATQETPYIEDLLRGLFIACTTTYCKYVSDWAFRGKLGPSSEFHIENTREYEYTDRRFWTKLFIQKSTIPMYLKESAQLIFETGKSVNLLNRIQRTISKMSQVFCSDTDTIIKPQLSFESLQQLAIYWQRREQEFFEENSFLKSSLEISIQNVIDHAFKIVAIDLFTVEQVKEKNAQRFAASKSKANSEQKCRSRQLMKTLQDQIQEDNQRKLQDESLPLFQRMKIKQYLDQIQDSQLEQTDLVKKNGIRDTQNSHGDVFNTSNDLHLPTSDTYFEPCVGGSGDGSSNGAAVFSSLTLQNSCGRISSDLDSLLLSFKEQPDNMEEKFNPEKIIVNAPPKYKSNYSKEFSKPLIPFVQSDDETLAQSHCLKYDPCCVNYFLSQSVLIPLCAQNRMINATLLHHLIVENNLFYHVSALNSFLCLQDGLFSYNLSAMLIQEVTNESFNNIDDIFRKTVNLNIVLSKALRLASNVNESKDILSNLSFSIEDCTAKVDKHKSTKEISKFSPLNAIRLNYTVGWPLNIILTDDLLANYDKIFVFLMQIVRAEMLLDRIFSVINFKKVRSKQLDTIHYCRYRMLHFVRTVRNYVNVTVIDAAWTDLCSSLRKMDSLDKIYDGLVRHIKFICSNCLHGAKAERLLKLLTDQLVIIENFCDQLENIGIHVNWDSGQEIPLHEFKKLIQYFLAAEHIGKVFMSVAWKMVQKGYYPKVDYFLKLYNFNGFFCQDAHSVSSEDLKESIS